MSATQLDSTGYPTQTYWAVPAHYTIGDAFSTREAALAEAAAKLSRMLRENDTTDSLNVLRVAVDEREKDNDGDRPVRRLYLTLTESRDS